MEADITTFTEKYHCNENVLFTSVFAYTLSRFAGNDKVFFNILEHRHDRFDCYDSIGMFENTSPILVNCKNQDIGSFMKYMSDVIYGVMSYNYYPFRLLANEYNLNSDIIFQYRPDWFIEGEVSYLENIDESSVKHFISGMNDLASDLSVIVTQYADKYNLNMMYSDKYSKEFIKNIGESFKLILQNISNVDKLSKINYLTSSDLMLLNEYLYYY